MITEFQNGNIRMLSRNGNEFTRFTKLSNSLSNLECDCIVAGEIVVLDQDGRPNFRKLMYSRKESYTYYVFDILYLNGKNLIGHPLNKEKKY